MLKKQQRTFSLFAMFFLLLVTVIQPLSTMATEGENDEEEVKSGTVLIEYVEVDQDNAVLRTLDKKSITEPYGTPYQAEEKSFEGLKLVETPKNAKGEIDRPEVIVTFKYKA